MSTEQEAERNAEHASALHRAEQTIIGLRRDVERLERLLGHLCAKSMHIVVPAPPDPGDVVDALQIVREHAEDRFASSPTTLREIVAALELIEMDEDGNLPGEAADAEEHP